MTGESGEGSRRKLPVPLRLFCAYLIALLPVIAVLESAYVLLSDDWTFGFRNTHMSNLLGCVLFFLLVGQHMYRLFTLAAVMLKARFAVANAKVYLGVSAAMTFAFVLTVGVSYPQPGTLLRFHADEVILPGVILCAALALVLPWWIFLSTSKSVRAFEISA